MTYAFLKYLNYNGRAHTIGEVKQTLDVVIRRMMDFEQNQKELQISLVEN